MSDESNPSKRSVMVAVELLSLLPLLIIAAAYTVDSICSTSGAPGVIMYLLTAGIGLAAVATLPQLIVASFAESINPQKHPRWHLAMWSLAGIVGASMTIFLFSDFCIYRHFSFHFNGFVFNLLITPGGFSSMGLDYATIIPATVATIFCYALYIFAAYNFARSSRFRAWCMRYFNWRTLAIVPLWLVPILALCYAEIAVGVADFYSYRRVLCVTNTYPLLPRVRMRKALKALGFVRPPRTAADAVKIRLSHSTNLNYPLGPIETVPVAHLPNIVWLCSESLRNDMLSKDIMPNSYAFAEVQCVRFNQHFSGGNGTRPGMFTMFYGIYANLWDQFLDANRPPVFFEWLRDSNYQMRASTSAKFTYPEFDRTVFAMLDNSQLEEMNGRLPAEERDIIGAEKLINFIENRDTSRPFFVFHFFEGTHAPYSFALDKAPFKPVLENLSYLKMSADDREPVINRARNAAYNVDIQIGKILAYLEEKGLLENTIVVITGDHGEEFYEHGHLGHNSTYVDEQICPPLAIHFPGVPAQKYNKLSQHTDIVPTIAPLLGRVGDATLYSVGHNLLDPTYNREYMIICGYSERVLLNDEGKYMLPVSPDALYSPYRLLRRDDTVDNDVDGFYIRHAAQMTQALKDMQRFLK